MLAAGLLAGACKLLDDGSEPETPEHLVQSALLAFRTGDVRLTDDILARARQRHPLHGGVLLWSAALAEMRWHDDIALQFLSTALRSPDRGGLTEAELHGRIGDLLFRMGRYGESLPHLNAGAVGSEQARRRAMAHLVTVLPYVQREPPAAAVEIPLLPQAMPEVICTLGGEQRSLVVDTGASTTTLASNWAAGVVPTATPAGSARDGMGRAFPVSMGLLPALDLGSIDAGPLPVLVVDDQVLALQDHFGGPRPISGLLGVDVLSRLRVTIDPRRASIELAPLGELPSDGFVDCLHVDGYVLAPVRVEGLTLWFVLDTGASHSSLTPQGLQALPGGERRAIEGFRHIRRPGGSGVSVRLVPHLTIEVSEARMSNLDLPVVQRSTPTGFPVHGLLGADLLMRCRMTLVRHRVRMEVVESGR